MAGFINWDIVGLGTKPDAVIARELNVCRRKVCSERNKRGINPFLGKILTQEEFPVRSIYEAMFDAVLHEKGTFHLHEVPVPSTRFKADFKIEDTFIEIAGMLQYPKYKDKYLNKKAAYDRLEIKVVWLEGQDVEELFKECKLEIKTRENIGCNLCGIKGIKLIKELCHKCYCKIWRKAGEREIGLCLFCGVTFNKYNEACKYCSKECYWNSIKLDLPSTEWLEKELRLKTLTQIAEELGVKYYTLHKRLYRSKKGRSQEKIIVTSPSLPEPVVE